jgi:UDP-glucose 4-epimerase
MTAVVVGASGFIGSHLVDALLAEGLPVRALVREGPGLLAPTALANPRLEVLRVDMADAQALVQVCAGTEVVFHLASSTLPHSSNLDPGFDVSSNLLGALHVLEAVRHSGGARMVLVSSGGTVYGPPQQVPIPEDHPTEPTCSYGITKLAMEKYVALYRQLHGVQGVVLRVANPYGERQRLDAAQGVVPVFLGKALRGEPLEIWGDGSTVRDFLHISDVVAALLAAWRKPSGAFVFNVGSGTGLSLKGLVQLIEAELGRPLSVIHHPARSFDVPTNVLCITRAQRCWGWEPQVSVAEGLRRFHRSLRDDQGNDYI